MARPAKKTVDYFPHQTNHGKTMFILESRWGNDGYAFWFKLLEILGDRDGMFLDCEVVSDWHFVLAKTKVSSETAEEILNTLASLDAIDANFWAAKVVYCQKFVDGVSDAFKRRTDHLPSISGVSAYINSNKPAFMCAITGKGKERKEKGKETKEKKTHGDRFAPPTIQQVSTYCQGRGNKVDPHKWFDYYQSNGWMVGKNKMKDWQAAVRTWERGDNYGRGNQESKRPAKGFAAGAGSSGEVDWAGGMRGI